MLPQNERLIASLRQAIQRVKEHDVAGEVSPGGWMLINGQAYAAGPTEGAPGLGPELPVFGRMS